MLKYLNFPKNLKKDVVSYLNRCMRYNKSSERAGYFLLNEMKN